MFYNLNFCNAVVSLLFSKLQTSRKKPRMPINKDEFRRALGHFASGVSVVTTRDASGRQHGITVSAFCSVSLEPPLISVCIEKNTGSHRAFLESDAFVVNILKSNQQHISERFASRVADKFEGVGYSAGIEDLAVLDGALANLECVLKHCFDAGDHTIFVGQIEKSHICEGEPLVYFQGNYREIKDFR